MQKHFSDAVRDWLLILTGAAVLIAALVLPLRLALSENLTSEEQRLINAWRNGEIIRIHIIANSDSPVDQALKLKVRDALIDAFGSLLSRAGEQGGDAVFDLLEKNVGEMCRVAQACAIQNGFSGKVSAEVGLLALPEKQYGSVTLPSGEYRALRVTLGKGEGQNWWCVLYPQLCLALAQTDSGGESDFMWLSGQIFRHWLLVSD